MNPYDTIDMPERLPTMEDCRAFNRAYDRWQRRRMREGTLTVEPIIDWRDRQFEVKGKK